MRFLSVRSFTNEFKNCFKRIKVFVFFFFPLHAIKSHKIKPPIFAINLHLNVGKVLSMPLRERKIEKKHHHIKSHAVRAILMQSSLLSASSKPFKKSNDEKSLYLKEKKTNNSKQNHNFYYFANVLYK